MLYFGYSIWHSEEALFNRVTPRPVQGKRANYSRGILVPEEDWDFYKSSRHVYFKSSKMLCFWCNSHMLHSLVTEFSVGDVFKQYRSVLKGECIVGFNGTWRDLRLLSLFSRSFHALIACAAQMIVFWISFFCNKLITYIMQWPTRLSFGLSIHVPRLQVFKVPVINTGNYNYASLYTST
jgi:hypothetical protein